MAAGLADDRVGDFPLLVETPPPAPGDPELAPYLRLESYGGISDAEAALIASAS